MTTPTLPVEGGDDQIWGTKLNRFLRVSHNEDGTLKLEDLFAQPGDMLVADAAGNLTRFPIGQPGQVAVVDPTAPLGLRYVTVSESTPDTTSSLTLTLVADGTVQVPTGTPSTGNALEVRALASGGARNLVFDSAFRTTAAVTSRTVAISSGQTAIVRAVYVDVAGGWVLTSSTQTTGTPPSGGGGGGGGSSLSAGPDASLPAGSTFSRTATEPSGVTITGRSWSIVDGPTGAGTVIGSAAALSWVPGSTPSGATDIRHPMFQEMAYRFTSTAENSTTDWTTSFSYIQDILDGRGYTGGIVGFTSATGDMLALVEHYIELKPSSNVLAPFLSGLQATTAYGDTVDDAEYGVDGGGASDIAASELGSAFLSAWATASADPVFRRAQSDLRRSMYWEPALAAAIADGVGAMGLGLYYDTSVNHGPGAAGSGDGSFDDIRSRTTGTKPASGGNQRTWLRNFISVRSAVLTEWGDNPSDGRVAAWQAQTQPTTPNYMWTGNVSWSMYGDPFSFNQPVPPADSVRGVYTLRYTASPRVGNDTVIVTVT